jgi:hypothetical protein
MQKSAIPFHLSGAELDKWRIISGGAVAMISLMRRRSGFWPYPPITKEIDQYFKGSTELAFSDAEDGSFTVTYAALLALHELSHQCPPRYLRDVEDRFRKMWRPDGSWGNYVVGFTKGGSVFDSARHTAFVLLTLGTFFRDSEIGDSTSSIRWLLEKQLPSHGWQYRELDGKDQAYSTAACIAALARYAVHHNRPPVDGTGEDAESQLIQSIGKAIDKGLNRLFAMQSDCGLWAGRLNEPNDLSGSANIIDLISLPEVASVANANRTGLSSKVAIARKSLIAAQRRGGWPSSPGNPGPSLPATIHVLFTVFDLLANARGDIDHQNLHSISAYLADQMINHEGGHRLDSWDWIMLARLCALILTTTEGNIMPEHEISEILSATESLKSSNSKLAKIAILSGYRFFRPWEKNVLFVVSRGSPDWWKPALATGRAVFTVAPIAKKLVGKYVEHKVDQITGLGL